LKKLYNLNLIGGRGGDEEGEGEWKEKGKIGRIREGGSKYKKISEISGRCP
jgi:hypothetical protein